jgi:hypothetical protein
VEDYLASLMDQEFDTIVDDGSITQVHVYVNFLANLIYYLLYAWLFQISKRLVDLWHEWKAASELPSVDDMPADSPMLTDHEVLQQIEYEFTTVLNNS